MASFRVALRTFSRAAGQMATAAVAYRCGTVVQDDRTGLTFGVEHTATLAPVNAPTWARDPAKLWNAVEAVEVWTNARTACELLVSLTYAQAFGRTRADVEALAFHGQRDPGCCRALARALEARQAVKDAQGGVAAGRDRREQAMVRTVEAQIAAKPNGLLWQPPIPRPTDPRIRLR